MIQHLGQAFHISLFNPLGPIGVFIFLFLSGYGLSCSYINYGRYKYIKRRISKIYIPYIISVMLFLLWSEVIHNQVNFTQIISYLTLTVLPQGSYWYLVLLFYWYFIFFILTFMFDNPFWLFTGLIIGIFLIMTLKNYNRLFVWQFFSFPIGLITAKFPEKVQKIIRPFKNNRGRVSLLILSFIIIIFKKLPIVELYEMGVIDTALQICLIWSLGLWLILKRNLLKEINIIKCIFLIMGDISYELYLAHAIPLDWLIQNATIIRMLIYFVLVTVGVIILKIFKQSIVSVQNT